MRPRALIGVAVLLPLLLGAGRAPVVPAPLPDAKVVILKSLRSLQLFSQGRLVRVYRIGLGTSPVGQKRRQGDRRTPEGTYRICLKNPRSQYYLSLQVSYPNRADADRGLADGLLSREQHARIAAAERRGAPPPSGTPLGGDIFIHGNGSSSDWTWGCMALDDKEMKEIFALVPVGTPVEIRP
jgi:murein L,D-transpeptidase YafK